MKLAELSGLQLAAVVAVATFLGGFISSLLGKGSTAWLPRSRGLTPSKSTNAGTSTFLDEGIFTKVRGWTSVPKHNLKS